MASREEVEMMGMDLGRGKGERGKEGEFGDDLMTKSAEGLAARSLLRWLERYFSFSFFPFSSS